MRTKVRLTVRRSPPPRPDESYVLEIVTPRTNAALISPAENLFSALQAGGTEAQPVALEIAAEGDRRRFLVRCRSQAEQRRVAALIGAAYPQAALRSLSQDSPGDPLALAANERCVCCTLRLRRPEYLPLRTFQDRDLDADAGPAQTDPVLGILMGLGDLPGAWRAVAQLVVLAPAPLHWARAYQRQALEQTIPAERASAGSGSGSIFGSLLLVALMGALLVGGDASNAWVRQDWGTLAILATGSIAALLVGTLLMLWLRRDQLYDPRLIQDKLSRDACLVERRLAIVAPLEADGDAIRHISGASPRPTRHSAWQAATASCRPAPSPVGKSSCAGSSDWPASANARCCSMSGSWPACGTCPRQRTT
jgi:hypothetical protein